MNDPSQQHIGTPALIRRFAPYLMRYKRILIFDLFCAALTTLCDIVLPKIMSYLTNAATDPGIVLTVDAVLKLALLYLILRLIDGAAQYFMSGTGHIMGVYIETDMRRDAFAHLQRLSHTYYSNTKVGQIMGRITNDLFDVTEFAHHCPEEFFNNVTGLEDCLEGGARCFKCYRLRLEKTATIASNKNYDYFTTTLSISPLKNSDKLNEIGKEISEKYNIDYLFSDFKKKEGYKRSIELSKEYNLYRQNYCGCVFSKRESLRKEE